MTVENNETNPTVHIYRNFRAILAHLKKSRPRKGH